MRVTPVPTRLLVVEDDDAIAVPLEEGLRREGFTVERAVTGEGALAAAEADLVLLDLGLPDLEGAEVCRRLRERSTTPIIVLTARGDELDRVMLLELGADDYVVKPFGFRELVARIRAVLRRSATLVVDADAVQRLGALGIDRRARRVTLAGDELRLAPKEFDLLARLAAEQGTVVRREVLMSEVWDSHWFGATKTLDVHVAALRRRIDDGAATSRITTVRGVGYRLDAP